jgi:hypothetical protein
MWVPAWIDMGRAEVNALPRPSGRQLMSNSSARDYFFVNETAAVPRLRS